MSARVSPSPIQYRGTSTNGSYYFCIEGLPKRFTWQDLKDLVRKEAAHGIWTEMAYFSNGQTGETGWARVQRQEEARRLYTFLANNSVQGRRLRIHLFDTSASQPELIAHTCGAAPCILNARSGERSRQTAIPTSTRPVAYQPYYTPPPTAYAVQPPSPYDYSPGPTMYSSVAPPPNYEYNMQALQASMADMRMDTTVAAARSRMAQMYAQGYAAQQPLVQSRTQNQTQGPIYVESPIGTRVNVGRGSVKTEIRGIFVSNIDYKAGSRDLEKYFKQAGEIVNFQLQKDPVTGKSKGNATVQYAAADHAKKAVRLFDRETYMGLRLKVRLDKEPIAVGVPSTTTSRSNGATSANRSSQQDRNSTEPIIVNGSIRYD